MEVFGNKGQAPNLNVKYRPDECTGVLNQTSFSTGEPLVAGHDDCMGFGKKRHSQIAADDCSSACDC